MKKHFTKITLSLGIILFLNIHSFAQLSGNYSIGANGTYPTFSSALSALYTQGVNGNVSFSIEPGIYTESLDFYGAIPGAGPGAEVVFDGDSQTYVTVQSSSDTFPTIRFYDADYITIKNMSIKHNGTINSTVILFRQNAENNRISNCFLEAFGNPTGFDHKVIMFSDHNSDAFYGNDNNGHYNIIEGNTIKGGYCGIIIQGNDRYATGNHNNMIINNSFTGQGMYGIYSYYGTAYLTIKGNSFDNFIDDAANCIYQNYCNRTNIEGNIMHPGRIGIYLRYENYTFSSQMSYITNNMISNFSNTSDQIGISLYYYCYNMQVYHNSIEVKGTSSTYSSNTCIYAYYYPYYSRIKNNILSAPNYYGYCLSFYYPYEVEIDANNYYYPISHANKFYGNGNYYDLYEWKNYYTSYVIQPHDENSISVDPQFISSNDLHLSSYAAGNNQLAPTVQLAFDIDGDTRPQSGSVMMGADQYIDSNDLDIYYEAPLIAKLGANNPIQVLIINNGYNTFSGNYLYVSYQVNSGNWVEDSIHFTNGLHYREDTIFTFSTPWYVNSDTNYTISVRIYPQINSDPDIQDIHTVQVAVGMEGIYTIDPYTTGNKNFTSFNDAVAALHTKGINGWVKFIVADGYYYEQVEIHEIIGASAVNTITFESASLDSTKVVLDYEPYNNNYVLFLNGADYLTFRKMTIKGNQVEMLPNVIVIENEANNNTFEHNVIQNDITYYYYGYDALVYSGNGNSNDINNIFYNNHFIGGSYAFNYSGIQNESGTIISSNYFESQSAYAISLEYQNSPLIQYNLIFSESDDMEYTGIAIQYSNDSIRIQRNRIVSPYSYSQYCKGISILECNGSVGAEILVANNMVTLNEGMGIASLMSSPINIFHNSVWSSGIALATTSPFIQGSGSISINNNNLYITGTSQNSAIIAIDTMTILSGSITSCDYNNYYSGAQFVLITDANNYNSLASWTAATTFDSNSLNVEPGFFSFTDLHSNQSALIDAGKALPQVNHDFDGDTRHPFHPVIGADEFMFISLGTDTTICPNECINLSPGPDYSSYLWNTASTDSVITVCVPGTYIVSVINAYGLTASDTIHVYNYPAIYADFSRNDIDQCLTGNNFIFKSLSNAGGYAFSNNWDFNDNVFAEGNQVSHSFDQDGTYNVKLVVETNIGCKDSITKEVYVRPIPLVYLGNDTSIVAGDSIVLDAGSFTAYQWNTGQFTQTLTVYNAGTYMVKVTDTNGCFGYDTIVISLIYTPGVNTDLQVLNITPTSAQSGGNISSTGGENCTEIGLCYKINSVIEPSVSHDSIVQTGDFANNSSFFGTMTNLFPGKHYQYRAFAKNRAGYGYGNTNDFYTLSEEPLNYPAYFNSTPISTSQILLEFSPASTINHANGYLIIMKQGNMPVGRPYDTNAYNINDPIGTGTVISIISDSSITSDTIHNLITGYNYYFLIYPFNWNASHSQTFNYKSDAPVPSSQSFIPYPPALLTSSVVNNIGSGTAEAGANIISTGGENAKIRGICLKEYAPGDPDTSDLKFFENGSYSTGSYTINLTGLTSQTRYKYRGFAMNSGGTAYGSSFDFYTLATEPAGHAVSFSAEALSTNLVNLSFSPANTINNAKGYLIIQKQGSQSSGLPYDAQAYNINSPVGNGYIVAVISDSSQSSTLISNVSAGNNYYYRLIPYNWDGNNYQTYNYNTNLPVPETSVRTVIKPTVATNPVVDSIDSKSAWWKGEIINSGGENNMSRGFCYKIYDTGDPDSTNSSIEENGSFSTGNYGLSPNSLDPGTRYKYRAFSKNSAGTGYGITYDFFTFSIEPENHALSFSAKTISTSQINLYFSAASAINNAKGYLVLQKQGSAPNGIPLDGNAYNTGNPLGDGIVSAIINNINDTSVIINNVSAGNTYYFTLIPYNWDNNNSETYNYLTTSVPVVSASAIVPPSMLTSNTITNITDSGASAQGTITDIGGANASQRGICINLYSLANDPDTSDLIFEEIGTFGTGTYTRNISSLSPQTHYKTRAYAINPAGAGYGNTVDFFTFSPEPDNHAASLYAHTESTTQIDLFFSAASSINNADGYIILQKQGVIPDGIPLDGQAYNSGNPLGNAIIAAIVNNPNDTSAIINSVSPGKTYYFSLIPFNWNGTNAETYNYLTTAIPNTSATTIVPPSLTTSSIIENISSSGAKVAGNISDAGAANATLRGICYNLYSVPADPDTSADKVFEAGSFGSGVFSSNLSSLNPETRYKARAFAGNPAGTGYGNIVDFYTLSVEPAGNANNFTATTLSTTQINLKFSPASSIADCDGYLILQKQGSSPTGAAQDGSAYSTGYPLGDGLITGIINSTSDSNTIITSISAGNTYYFKLIPYNWDGTHAETYNYLTSANPTNSATSIVLPVVNTGPVSSITHNTASANGNISDVGGQNPSQRGTCYTLFSAPGDPDTSDNKTVETGSFSTGSYNSNCTGLLAETHYKYRAFATNYAGTGYGLVLDFYTLSSEPTAQAAIFTATTINTNLIQLNFSAASTISNADGYIVLQKQGSLPLSVPNDAMAYNPGTPIGDAIVSAVITNTLDTMANITSVSAGNSYYFVLIPYNWNGSNSETYNYYTNAAPSAFAATIVPPTLTTSPTLTNISNMSAEAEAAITDIGGAQSQERGFVYKPYAFSGDPDTSNSKVFDIGNFGAGVFTKELLSLSAETRYKVRSYAINSAGIGYGETRNFFTLSEEPAAHAASFTAQTISTTRIDLNFSPASSISNAAGYIILQRQGAAPTGIPEDGKNYSIGNPIGDATITAIINNTVDTNAVITSVSAGNTYYFTIIPYNWDATHAETYNYRTQASIPETNATSIIIPLISTTNPPDSIIDNSALLSGSIVEGGGSTISIRGFAYKVFGPGDPTTADMTKEETGSFSSGSFSAMLTLLNPETRYKFRAYATNIAGTGYGNTYDFFTLSLEPLSHVNNFTASTSSTTQIDLSFDPASTISNCNGYIILQKQNSLPGGLPVDAHAYSIGNPIEDATVAAIITDTSISTASITSVSAGNTYYFVIIPFNWNGNNAETYNYLNTGMIPNTNATTIVLPTVSTSETISDIDETSAKVQGNIQNTGGANVNKRGICYKAYAPGDPDIQDWIKQDSGSFSTGSFTKTLDNLTSATHYKARAYASNSAGTAYGNTYEFFTLALEPLQHASAFSAMTFSTSQIDLSFSPFNNIPDANGYIIVMAQGTLPLSHPQDGKAYAAGNSLGNGSVAALINNPGQFDINITNLNAGTEYFFKIYPFNWDGSNPETYNYLTQPVIPEANATTIQACPIDPRIRISGSPVICWGDSLFLQADTTSGLTYQWTLNGNIISSSNTSSLWAKESGEYRVFINNDFCSIISTPFNLTHYPVELPIIIGIGNIAPCQKDSMQLTTEKEYAAYIWNTGKTDDTIWVSKSDDYTVKVLDNYGCWVESYPFPVNAASVNTPNICMVSVDTFTNMNIIIWERPQSTLIDSYFIYKETVQSNVYKRIGALDYYDLSVFVDTNSNPAVKADRYKISILDSCGVESPLSPHHKTMHLQINEGVSGVRNLHWDYYEGFSFSTYDIYRGTTPNNLKRIASIQNNLTSFTDLNPPSGITFYQVVVVKPDTCYPAIVRAQTTSGPFSQSMSNLKDYGLGVTPFINILPYSQRIQGDSGASATFVLYTNIDSWTVNTDATWLQVYNNILQKRIVVVADENKSFEARTALLTVQGLGIPDQILQVIQEGNLVSINEISSNTPLRVYPNPFSQTTTIELPQGDNIKLIEIYDLSGKLKRRINDPGEDRIELNRGDLAKGIYMLRVIGNKVYTEKIMIE